MLADFRRKKNNGAGRKKKQHQEDEMPDDERAAELQGWLKVSARGHSDPHIGNEATDVQCKMCCITSHWHCLSPQQQKDVRWALMDIEGPPAPGERKRTSVRIDETFEFTCARCAAGGKCMVCNEGPRVIESADEIRVKENARADGQGDVEMKDEDLRKEAEQRYKPFFRCYRCKQACHYEHRESTSRRTINFEGLMSVVLSDDRNADTQCATPLATERVTISTTSPKCTKSLSRATTPGYATAVANGFGPSIS